MVVTYVYHYCPAELRSPKIGCFNAELWDMSYNLNLIELKQNKNANLCVKYCE
jgi:hypothetical protein